MAGGLKDHGPPDDSREAMVEHTLVAGDLVSGTTL